MSAKTSAAEEARKSAMAAHAREERERLGLTKKEWRERNRTQHAAQRAARQAEREAE